MSNSEKLARHEHPASQRNQPSPSAWQLQLRADGQLELTRGAERTRVRAVRCFPWSEGDQFISLRDAENHEVALIESVEQLDAESRAALERALAVARFVLEVTAVLSVEEDCEIRAWKVRTAHGIRSFQTPLDAWPRRAPGGGHVIEDVAGDVYLLPALEQLDPISRKLLWPYVD
jgi:hypothetical protein